MKKNFILIGNRKLSARVGSVIITSLLIAAGILFIAGCPSPFMDNSGTGTSSADNRPAKSQPARTGYFVLTIEGLGANRTIMPNQNDYDVDDLRIELEFLPGYGNFSDETPTFTNYASGDPVALPVGTWNLNVFAYDDGCANPVMADELENIEIRAGSTAGGTVALKPVDYEGEGIFSWNITWEEGVTVTEAEIAITPITSVAEWLTEDDAASLTLLVSGTSDAGNSTLPSGYYRVVVTLTDSSDRVAKLRETLHVYNNRDSNFTHNFTSANFFSSLNPEHVTVEIKITVEKDGNTIIDIETADWDDPAVGETLKACVISDPYPISSHNYSYSWYRCETIGGEEEKERISGEYEQTYTLTEEDIGYTIFARVAPAWQGLNGSVNSGLTEKVNAADGTTIETPFRVYDAEDMEKVGSGTGGTGYDAWKLNSNYRLMADISLAGVNWKPIGIDGYIFNGTFDGGKHTISNMMINSSGTHCGLFGNVGGGGSVMNVGLEGVNIKFKTTSASFVGSVAGRSEGKIANCYATGTVNVNVDYNAIQHIGGLAGSVDFNGAVADCYSACNVTVTVATSSSSQKHVGGVAGSVNGNGKIENCYAAGTVTLVAAGGNFVGGIVGSLDTNNNPLVKNCIALNVSVTAAGASAGRIAGRVASPSSWDNNYAREDMLVNGETVGSGLVGNGINGDDVGTGSINELWWSTILTDWDFGDEGVWVWKDNTKLPILRGFTAAQDHKIKPFAFEGEGLESKPFEIHTAEDLALLAMIVNAGTAVKYIFFYTYYILMDNISLENYASGYGWTPIGTNISSFLGIFDGNTAYGYTISGLTINDANTAMYIGLFGLLGTGSEVKNLGLTGVKIASDRSYVGGIAGGSDGKVEKCYVNGDITGASNVGGIVGATGTTSSATSSIVSCYAEGAVTASGNVSSAGGIVGQASIHTNGSTTTVENCYAVGTVTAVNGSEGYAGGIVGKANTVTNSSTTVKECYTMCTVLSSGVVNSCAGGIAGIAGMTGSTAIIENCYATGAVTTNGGSSNAGGVVGSNTGTITKCYATGSVTANGGSSNAGGVVGSNSGGTVEYCVALNSSVTATGSSTSDTGRVAGLAATGINYNYALLGMLVNGNTVTGSISGIHGDIATWKTGTWWTGTSLATELGFDTSVWEFVDGNKLPILQSIPADVQPPPQVKSGFEGSGLESDPYLIYTAADLALLATVVNAGNTAYSGNSTYYRLEADIDLSGYKTGNGWTPIGATSPLGVPISFNGIFDGNGKTITGLTINASNGNQGLFGWNSGTVKNIGLIDVNISSDGSTYTTGGVAGQNEGIIQQCYVTGTVSSVSNVGGIVGANSDSSSIVMNCYSTATVSGDDMVGGIVGSNGDTCKVQNCYATGTVSGDNNVGGIVGQNYTKGTVQQCAALNPSVTITEGGSLGRVVGDNEVLGVLSFNYARSDMLVNGELIFDGDGDYGDSAIHGDNVTSTNWTQPSWWTTSGQIEFSGTIWDLSVLSQKLPILEGFDKTKQNPQIEYVFEGSGTSDSPFGIGEPEQLALVAAFVNAGIEPYNAAFYLLTDNIDLSDDFYSGWIPIGDTPSTCFKGNFDGGADLEISNLYINDGSGDYKGLFGYCKGATIKNVTLAGVNIIARRYAGGIAGYIVNNGTTASTVENCYVTVEVEIKAQDCVGGVVGYSGNSEIIKCYAEGEVTSINDLDVGIERIAGGIVGYNNGGTVQYCSSNVTVNAKDDGGINNKIIYAGGVAGRSNWVIEKCYATGDVKIYATAGVDSAFAGGIVGYNLGGNVKDCYATGDIISENSQATPLPTTCAGGIVGYHYYSNNDPATVSGCYATGDVSAKNSSGGSVSVYASGIVGLYDNSATPLSGNVALNLNVSAESSSAPADAARICNFGSGTSGSNNYGRIDMQVNEATVSGTPLFNDKNGENIGEEKWYDGANWWQKAGPRFDADTWDFDDSGTILPTLKGMPDLEQEPTVKEDA